MSFTRTLRAVGSAAVAGALLFGTAPVASADQVREDQWALKAFKAEDIWRISKGKGVTVAVIDDGVDAQHQDLKGNVLSGKDFIDGGSADPEGGDTHGTHMAGIIAGHGHGAGAAEGVMGLAPEAKILPIRDSGLKGKGFGPSIRYAVDQGASVINISQGGSDSSGDAEAISYALKHDVLVVASSGNEGAGPEVENYPSQYPGVVAVGGVKSSGELWEGSNYGPSLMLTAPATGIVSTGGRTKSFPYGKGSGTSDASAYVSATAALLQAKFPDLTAGQIANRLVKTAGLPASAKERSLPDEKYGYGFIQPLAALERDIPAGSKNGPLKSPAASSSESGDAAPENSGPNSGSTGSEESESDISLAPIALGVLALLVVAAVVVIVVVKRRKGRNGPPPGGPGGYGGSGGYGAPSGYGAPGSPGPYGAPPQPNQAPPGSWSNQQQ
ncbi:S8 family serine peptidase [Streptomyces sp. NPDC004647]|uniref:S8 family serine peptidase n=1 Tax=Streptomyces sp. NPDC004647 TaxID=3154671 RepID=UPI0033A31545